MILHASSVRRKRKKKIKQMTMVRQFQACETIVQTATVKGDEDILRVTGAVNSLSTHLIRQWSLGAANLAKSQSFL